MPESSRIRSLNREGSAYLSNYARTINAYPLRTEKLAILGAIHAIPGNETFTLNKLSSWFTRHRNDSQSDTYSTVLLDDETILFPKLSPTHLQQLRVLYKKVNDPTEGVITFWAKRLNAEREELAAWIEYQQEKAKDISVSESPDASPTVPEFPRPHLPTPAKSLSPNTRMPSLPPIAIKEESRKCFSPVLTPSLNLKPSASHNNMHATDSISVLENAAPLSRRDAQSSQQISLPNALSRIAERSRSDASLVASIRESLRVGATADESPPKTADEFVTRFEKVEHMIDAFMSKFQSGQLAHLGWDSIAIKQCND